MDKGKSNLYAQKVNLNMTQQNFEEIIKGFKLSYKQKKGQLIMGNETEKKQFKMDLGSTKLSNIIAIIGVIISVISLCMANEAMQKVENNIKTENVGSVQTASTIINEGASLEEVDYVANEMMDKAYQAEDIIRLVNENPNLSFCLLWHGTEEEYQNTDWDKMPPNIKIEKYDDKTNTVTFSYN